MPSKATILKALAALQAVYPRELTAGMIDAYTVALSDMSDAALQSAVGVCLRTCKFFPVPSELREAGNANLKPSIDVAKIIAAIADLSTYHPNIGQVWPRIDAIRARCGDAIAVAYAQAGGSRIFADNETTRDIARQAFARELADGGATPEEMSPWLIGAAPSPPLLTAG